MRSAMSGIEGDTFVETLSIAPHDLLDDDRDLTKCFDFRKKPDDAWRLPVAESKEEILDVVAANQVVVLSGPTGCGKSTQVPQYILDKHAKERKAVNILVTQPRKIAASSLASRVCRERGWVLGGLVGYQVGLSLLVHSPHLAAGGARQGPQVPRHQAPLRHHRGSQGKHSMNFHFPFWTFSNVLPQRMLIAQKNMNQWTHVILDEVHEREEDMDLVMLICKKLLLTNSRGTKVSPGHSLGCSTLSTRTEF